MPKPGAACLLSLITLIPPRNREKEKKKKEKKKEGKRGREKKAPYGRPESILILLPRPKSPSLSPPRKKGKEEEKRKKKEKRGRVTDHGAEKRPPLDSYSLLLSL